MAIEWAREKWSRLWNKTTPRAQQIKIGDPIPIPKEVPEVLSVTDQTRQQLKEQAKATSLLSDFIFCHLALPLPGTEDFSMRMVRRDYTVESMMQLLEELKRDEVEADEKALARLMPVLAEMTGSHTEVKAALARVRDEFNRYSVRALLEFPAGVTIGNTIYPPQEQVSPSTVVFFHPIQRCTMHALDDLYKEHRDQGFYVPHKDVAAIRASLQPDPQTGIIEYVIKGPRGDIKQNPYDFLLGAGQNGISNDPAAMLLSEFYARNSS